MALFISSIASGSNGNCYYVGTASEAVLIDAGISCREVERRMHGLGLSLQAVKGIFISHEHSDHIQGVAVLAKKYALPVYITTPTLQHGRLQLSGHPVRPFFEGERIAVGALTVTAFSKAHDAADPHSFVVTGNGVTVGVFTDMGVACAQLKRYFNTCHAAFLEANYDEQLLQQGNYPARLKARIRGGRGHLSNGQALEVFKMHKPACMSHLLLAHLSKNNNCPKLVADVFRPHAGSTRIVVAPRYAATPVYEISPAGITATPHYNPGPAQLALF